MWVGARGGHIYTYCTDTHDRDQNLIGGIFGPLSLDRTVKRALTLDCQPGMGGVWVESKDRTHLDLDLSSANEHPDRLIVSNFTA